MSLLLPAFLLAALTPSPSPSPSPSPAEPLKVKVGCYVLNVGKFDVVTGSYTVDFYLDLTADPKTADLGDLKFEFMNGRAASVDKQIDTPGEKFYRIQANLATNVDLHRFPWDKHDIPIIIEPATRTTRDLVFEVDEKQAGIDPAVVFVGWKIEGWGQTVREHVYPVYGESYSQYAFSLRIGRIILVSTLKTFLPVLCFLIISFVSLLVTVEKLDSRIGMNTAMLIASVLYHLSIVNELPPAGYLTVADKVMVATYSTIGVNLIISVHMMRLHQLGKLADAEWWRETAFWLIPGLAVLGYAICTIF